MKQLTPIELEDGTVIYMEVQEDIEVISDETTTESDERELTRGDLGIGLWTNSKMIREGNLELELKN